MREKSRSARIRERLNHPIIDSDGHVAEFEPAFFDYLKNVAGSAMVDRLKSLPDSPWHFRWYQLTPEERRRQRVLRPHWWVHPTRNTLDRATSSLPRLLHRAAGRDGPRLHDHLSEYRAAGDASGRRRTARRRVPRVEQVSCRNLSRVSRSDDAGRGDPDAFAGRGDRGNGVCGGYVGTEGR